MPGPKACSGREESCNLSRRRLLCFIAQKLLRVSRREQSKKDTYLTQGPISPDPGILTEDRLSCGYITIQVREYGVCVCVHTQTMSPADRSLSS